jgi:hypothetical protein
MGAHCDVVGDITLLEYRCPPQQQLTRVIGRFGEHIDHRVDRPPEVHRRWPRAPQRLDFRRRDFTPPRSRTFECVRDRQDDPVSSSNTNRRRPAHDHRDDCIDHLTRRAAPNVLHRMRQSPLVEQHQCLAFEVQRTNGGLGRGHRHENVFAKPYVTLSPASR